jgi:fumarate reductase subunit C
MRYPHTYPHSPPHPYTDYHPRWYRRHLSTWWWLQKWPYFAFILREASCLFVAWFVAFLLLLVRAVSRGEASYVEFLAWSARPAILGLNILSFLFIVYHAITFFTAAPRAMVVHVGRSRVPEAVVGGAHYAGLIAASLLIAWLLLGE